MVTVVLAAIIHLAEIVFEEDSETNGVFITNEHSLEHGQNNTDSVSISFFTLHVAFENVCVCWYLLACDLCRGVSAAMCGTFYIYMYLVSTLLELNTEDFARALISSKFTIKGTCNLTFFRKHAT